MQLRGSGILYIIGEGKKRKRVCVEGIGREGKELNKKKRTRAP